MSETSGETPRKMHILKKEDDDDKDVIEEYRDQVEIRNDKKTQPRNAVRNSPKNAQRIEVMNNVRNEVMNNARTEVKNTVRAEVKNGVMNNLRNNSNLYTQNAKIDVQSNTSKQSQNRRLSAFDKSRFIQLLQ